MKAIVDCNNFYCSCEQVFRPDLKGQPIVVLNTNNDCIIARNAAAKRLGVGKAGTLFKKPLNSKEHQVTLFYPNYNLYAQHLPVVTKIK